MKGLVCSVMHIGTWFTFSVLERLTGHPVVPWGRAIGFGDRGEETGHPFEWLHVHVGAAPETHAWEPHAYLQDALTEALVERARYPTVVPVRDPVLALITKENRRDPQRVPRGGTHVWIVEAFDRVARWWALKLPHVHLFPVDLYATPEERALAVLDLVRFLGLDPDAAPVWEIAEGWTPQNETEDVTELRAAYRAGDMGRVLEELPEETSALAHRRRVHEMLAALGYQLPWMEVVA